MCSKTLQHTAVSEIGLYLSGEDLSPLLKIIIGIIFAVSRSSGKFPDVSD